MLIYRRLCVQSNECFWSLASLLFILYYVFLCGFPYFCEWVLFLSFFMNDFFLSPLVSCMWGLFFYTILLSLLWVASRLFSSYLVCRCFLTIFLDYPWCLSCLFYEWLFSTVFSFSCPLYEWLLSLSSRILFKIGFSYSSFVFLCFFFVLFLSRPLNEWLFSYPVPALVRLALFSLFSLSLFMSDICLSLLPSHLWMAWSSPVPYICAFAPHFSLLIPIVVRDGV